MSLIQNEGDDHCAASGTTCGKGPGFASPLEAMKGPREKTLYVTCVVADASRPDYLAVIDVDPHSENYLKVLHRSAVPNLGDELHHMNWNTCSSCFGNPSKLRDKLILPCLKSDRIYTFDLSKNALAPELFAVVDNAEVRALNLSAPHTPHCLPSGDVMISTMGDARRQAAGSFLLLDGETFKPKSAASGSSSLESTCIYGNKRTPFGYDFWYQPRHDVMVSTEWGAPCVFEKGFDLSDLNLEPGAPEKYGHRLHFWRWSTGQHFQTIDLGEEGLMPLEVRFLHNPEMAEGYVGCAISGAVFHFVRTSKDLDAPWRATRVVWLPPLAVDGWCLPEMPHCITDILISLDDRFLYLSCWLTGEVRQYNIQDTSNPKLTGLCAIGGCIRGGVALKDKKSKVERPQAEFGPNRKQLRGGPQMLQLSLDGRRLYLTTSLFSSWDRQFYPDMADKGSMLVRLLVDPAAENDRTLCVDSDFLVDFADEPDGPALAHEIRYPGGDCSSDIWA